MSGARARVNEEREVKLAVPDGFVLPSLTSLDGVSVSDGGELALDAVYWDTHSFALAAAGVALRHRSGVWGFKGRSRRDGDAVVRDEVELPGTPADIPQALLDHVAAWADRASLRPVARVCTARRVHDVAQGSETAEVVHDRVRVLDGERAVGAFEEVEVEYALASDALAGRLVQLVIAAGGEVSATPKLVRALRALGHEPPPQ